LGISSLTFWAIVQGGERAREKLVERFMVTGVMNLDEKESKSQGKPTQGEELREATVVSTPEQKQVIQQGLLEPTLDLRIADLEKQLTALKSEFGTLKKPKEEPKRESCKCVLTKEGFWARFHQLRSEGLSKSDAFRLVSLEVLEAAIKQKQRTLHTFSYTSFLSWNDLNLNTNNGNEVRLCKTHRVE